MCVQKRSRFHLGRSQVPGFITHIMNIHESQVFTSTSQYSCVGNTCQPAWPIDPLLPVCHASSQFMLMTHHCTVSSLSLRMAHLGVPPPTTGHPTHTPSTIAAPLCTIPAVSQSQHSQLCCTPLTHTFVTNIPPSYLFLPLATTHHQFSTAFPLPAHHSCTLSIVRIHM